MRTAAFIIVLTLTASFAAPQSLRSQEYLDPPLRWEDAQQQAQTENDWTPESQFQSSSQPAQFGEYQPNPEFNRQDYAPAGQAYQSPAQEPFGQQSHFAPDGGQPQQFNSGGFNGALHEAGSSRRVPSMLSGYRYEVFDEVTRGQITALISSIDADESMEQAQKDMLKATLEDALEQIGTKETLDQNTENFELAAGQASQSAEQIGGVIDELKTEPPPLPDGYERFPIRRLEEEVNRFRGDIETLTKDIETNQAAITARIERRQSIRNRLTELEAELVELESTLEEATVDEESLVQQAARFHAATVLAVEKSRQSALSAELEMIEAEESVNLLQLERERLTIELAAFESNLGRLEHTLTATREAEAQRALQAANRQSENGEPLLQASLNRNLDLATLAIDLTDEIKGTRKSNEDLGRKLRTVEQAFREARDRERLIGLSSSVGNLLRQQRAQLPDERVVVVEAARVQERIAAVRFQLFELDEQRISLNKSTVKDELFEVHGELSPETLKSLDEQIVEITDQRRAQLEAAYSDSDDLYTELLKLEATANRLSAQTAAFRDYITERIFWIRSNDTLFTSLELDDGDKPLTDSRKWTDVRNRLQEELKSSPLFYTLYAVAILGLLVLRPGFQKKIDRLGQQSARSSCATIWPTARTVVLTVLIALPLALLPLIAGFRIFSVADSTGDGLFRALGTALLTTSWFILPIAIFHVQCRPGGLAHRHFSWSDRIVRTLRTNVAWAIPVGVILTFGTSILYAMQSQKSVDLIERILFVAGMIALTVVLYRCFRPKTGMFSEYLNANGNSWANRTSTLWFGAILFIPVSLAVLAFTGYYYTAINLVACVYSTFVFALVIETARELLQRFILVRRRRAHITARKKIQEQRDKEHEAQRELARAKERENEQSAAMAAGEDNGTREIAECAVKATSKITEKNVADITASAAALEADLLDASTEDNIDENAKKAGKLVSTAMLLVWLAGIWLIWADVLPALRALDNYVIWPAATAAVSPETSAPGTAQAQTDAEESQDDTAASERIATGTALQPADTVSSARSSTRVTVKDLLVFLMIATATLITARNFPSLLEMFFLDQLPVDHSVRNAVKSLTSYAILVVGLIFAFRSISIGWSEVQWLVTALTFGLAFGLQEIFANFVAGIIILFERPMRIGDIITVDNVSGVVSKIRTRATTIISWDRKEYVIPNKDFITGRLLNWTLSDKVNRVVIDVGVAYGSDVDKARQLLYQVCASHPMILDEPPTIVTFDKFGDSALNFKVRAFLPDIDCRLPTIDSLHTAIHSAFAEAGIDICFPQQDLHIRSMGDEIVDLLKGGSDAA
ncbi:MAG: mechanosensitive ion channel domain-containing protein [Planctomycetota bacterium]